MFTNLKQFVPSEVCLKCDGCCRFKEPGSVWRPRVSKDEAQNTKRPDLLTKIFTKERVDSKGFLKTTACKGEEHFCCSFFNPKENTCTIYQHRPFECKLYPFVMTKKDSRPVLSVHLTCPHIERNRHSPDFEIYTHDLKGFFARADVKNFLESNPELFGEYPGYEHELEYLFDI